MDMETCAAGINWDKQAMHHRTSMDPWPGWRAGIHVHGHQPLQRERCPRWRGSTNCGAYALPIYQRDHISRFDVCTHWRDRCRYAHRWYHPKYESSVDDGMRLTLRVANFVKDLERKLLVRIVCACSRDTGWGWASCKSKLVHRDAGFPQFLLYQHSNSCMTMESKCINVLSWKSWVAMSWSERCEVIVSSRLLMVTRFLDPSNIKR